MPLRIKRHEKSYTAEASPPHARVATSLGPMSREALYDALEEMGCHPIDIEDAFNEAEGRFPPSPLGARK